MLGNGVSHCMPPDRGRCISSGAQRLPPEAGDEGVSAPAGEILGKPGDEVGVIYPPEKSEVVAGIGIVVACELSEVLTTRPEVLTPLAAVVSAPGKMMG